MEVGGRRGVRHGRMRGRRRGTGAGVAALGTPSAWGRRPVKGTQVTAVLYAAHLVAEAGGLLVGTYEAEPVEYDMERLPTDFEMSQMRARRDEYNVAVLIDAARERFPFINERTPMAITTG